MTCFTSDFTFEVSRILFENFLLYGEDFIIKFIYKCVKVKEKKIRSMDDELLLRYVKHEMIEECLRDKR